MLRVVAQMDDQSTKPGVHEIAKADRALRSKAPASIEQGPKVVFLELSEPQWGQQLHNFSVARVPSVHASKAWKSINQFNVRSSRVRIIGADKHIVWLR